MNMRQKRFRSFVLLGRDLRDLIEMHDDDFILDQNELPHDYIFSHIFSWLKKENPEITTHSKEKTNIIIHEIIEYIIAEYLLSRDPIIKDASSDTSYDLHTINTNENLDGGKHIGTSFRDNGAFGSLPLYDDYSEEGES